jgi:two-component system, OmpR family, response regulator
MKILLVEDEERLARTIKKGLEMERFIVDIAHRGDEGYDLAATQEYDLIILDRMLPGMEGLEICQALRKENITTPILMLTARSTTIDKVTGLDGGADDYLAKPFEFIELLARIRSLIRRPPLIAKNILRVEDLIVDTHSYEVRRGKELLRLTQREFALLLYLMQHENRIVTKDQIIQHVWEYDADILPNTVEAYIRHLRQKVDEPFHQRKKLIHTVRGFGYQLTSRHV